MTNPLLTVSILVKTGVMLAISALLGGCGALKQSLYQDYAAPSLASAASSSDAAIKKIEAALTQDDAPGKACFGKTTAVVKDGKRFELDYLQGDEVDGFEGTCALTSVANLLTQSGKPTTEGDVVRRAIDNQWAVTDANLPSWQRGGSNANEQLQLLNSYGLRADLLAGYNETRIANLVRSGRGVIVAVDAGVIWESTQYETGQVNHAVTLTGAVYTEADGALLGFYVTDSGRAKVSDMTRFIPIDLFREAANVPGAYSLYTIEPVKLWDENIDGTGNDGANQITGNRGDNLLAGMAGDDTLVGLKSRRWRDGGAWQRAANDAGWKVAA